MHQRILLVPILPILLGFGGALLGACDRADPADGTPSERSLFEADGFSANESALIRTLSPLPEIPKDSTNRFADNPGAAALGQMLFYDASYSGAIVVADDGANGGLGAAGDTGKVSCSSCHSSAVFADGRSKPGNVSLGIDFGTRNALPIVNSSFYPWASWGGRFDSSWSLSASVAENSATLGSTRLQIAHLIDAKYKTEYEGVFGALDPGLDARALDAARFPATGKPKGNTSDPDGPWELMTESDRSVVDTIFANFGKAIQAYTRLLVSGNSAFDKYVAGDQTAISEPAKQGLRVFIGKGQCLFCHSGPMFSDGSFHALGVPQAGSHAPPTDLGRLMDVDALLTSPFNAAGNFSDDKTTGKLVGVAHNDALRGQFRTPTLRNVALSGPYMHAGQFATLAEVVAFYNAGGGAGGEVSPLNLSSAEEANLAAFLATLNGEPVPAALQQNTSK